MQAFRKRGMEFGGDEKGTDGGASQRQGEDLLETWIITVFVAKQPFHH